VIPSDQEVDLMYRNFPPTHRARRVVGAAVVGALALAAGTALAANNNVEASNAGQGVDVVAGFDVTDVTFDADPTAQPGGAPQPQVDAVSFAIARSGGQAAQAVEASNATVFVQLRAGGSAAGWAACTVGSGASAGQATCPTTGSDSLPVTDVDGLSVVAYDS